MLILKFFLQSCSGPWWLSAVYKGEYTSVHFIHPHSCEPFLPLWQYSEVEKGEWGEGMQQRASSQRLTQTAAFNCAAYEVLFSLWALFQMQSRRNTAAEALWVISETRRKPRKARNECSPFIIKLVSKCNGLQHLHYTNGHHTSH